jgi:leader peptidase (prepilin peptidase)/N-methyltransferase
MASAILAGGMTVLLLAVTITDLRARVIPDIALAPAAALALAVAAASTPETLAERAAAAGGAGGFLLAAALARPGGMGLGDVKLAAVLGLFLGRAVVAALLVALATGAIWGIAAVAIRGGRMSEETIPFAPFLATGAAVAWMAADNVDTWS